MGQLLPTSTVLTAAHDSSLLCGLQHCSIPLIGGDNAIELFQLIGFTHRYAKLFDHKSARVVDDIAFYFGLRVIAGEAEIGIDGRRQFVDLVSGG